MSATFLARTRRKFSSSAAFQASVDDRAARELAVSLCEQIASRADACAVIAGSLDDAGRTKLMHALVASESSARGDSTSIDGLFTSFDQQSPYNYLDRAEFQAALLADRAARPERKAAPLPAEAQPSSFAIGLASSVPFVGMGAVDNAIMLVAGSEIDALFGAKLGLSTLAAAGLGNMISDIAGVSMANRIENLTRKSKWINAAAFKAGSRTPRGRAAKLTGSIVGVSVGCLIGMAPLLFMDTHDHADS